jgi:hypothetical protein
VIKPAYSVSFLLSINIFVWHNVLYFLNDLRSFLICHINKLMLVLNLIYLPMFNWGLGWRSG